MPNIHIMSSCIVGVDSTLVHIETHITRGLNSFSVIGLGDRSVREAKDRVSASINKLSIKSPKQCNQKTTISLAPGDLKKEGSIYDLGIALSYLLSIINKENFSKDTEEKDCLIKIYCGGELGLDGKIYMTKGLISGILTADQNLLDYCFIPYDPRCKDLSLKKTKIIFVKDIKEAYTYLKRLKEGKIIGTSMQNYSDLEINEIDRINKVDQTDLVKQENSIDKSNKFSLIKGMRDAKKSLVVALTGRLHIGIYGPRGTGKSMLASCLYELSPDLDQNEINEVSKIYSADGTIFNHLKIPYRRPDKNMSVSALLGGGRSNIPGEVTLSHKGILHIDELLECKRDVIEGLRDPLQYKTISISRANKKMTYPCDFMFVCTMNKCPCSDIDYKCRCSHQEKIKYKSKMSSAISDRIHIWIDTSTEDEMENKKRAGFRNWHEFIDNADEIKRLIMKSRKILKKGVSIDEKLHKKIFYMCKEKGWSNRAMKNIEDIAKTESALDERVYVCEKDIFLAIDHISARLH